ncbi:GNAT family N-acetyltransferase [Pseudomonas sp. MOIL14HWK12:I2]|uniref:GNAT family N-acetyltransferase n=1 Tax=Pseudomonas sp. MOIL14HWK12:I2 TaxID=1033994 RepID=UPI00042420D0|nr:GNAT family N-acyltransferase [Pseudomonas sp. MOIL14HWK12:I2]
MPIPVSAPPALRAERLSTAADIRAAQRLRANVFGSTYGVHFADNLDQDVYDAHCLHLGVRDLRSGELIATTRLLDGRRRERLGSLYSESEFQLEGLDGLQGPLLEIGRTCVAPGHRTGAAIALLWAELAEIMACGDYRYLMGCASVPMADGGLQAAALLRQAARDERTPAIRATPRRPLPFVAVPDNLVVQLPPLLKAYLRLGAQVCGAPCWDPEFGVADVFILLKREDLCPRYARHFKAAV